MKRFISMLLCLIMMLSTIMVIVPVHVHAEGTDSSEPAGECGAEPVNVNAMDSDGLFPYVEDIIVDEGNQVAWTTWASGLGYQGMFDNSNDTFSVATEKPNVGLRSAVEYKEPMYITEVVIYTNVSSAKMGTAVQSHAKVEVSLDGENWKLIDEVEITNEARFEVNETVLFVKATCYSSNDWFGEIAEFYAFSEIGHNYDTLDEEKSTPSTCTKHGTNVYKCVCGAEMSVEAPLHNLISETVTKRPTINQTGLLEGECKDCHETIERVIPMLDINDYVSRVTADDVVVTEELAAGAADHPKRNKDAIIDGIINYDPYAGNGTHNIWFGPSGSKLIITFKEEMILYTAKLHAYSNWNSVEVDFLDASGTSVYTYSNSSFQPAEKTPTIFTDSIKGKKIKSIVITSVSAKQDGSTTLTYTELEMTAHKCEYDLDEITNVVEGDNCAKTFDGTCTICEWSRTGINRNFHNNVRDEQEADNYFAATCVSNGYEKLICQDCFTKTTVVEYATGIHDFKDAEIKYENDQPPTCGAGAKAWPLCNVCDAKGEEMTFEPTGEHSYEFKVTTPSTYTNPGIMQSACTVCDALEPGSEPTDAPLETLKTGFTALDYSIRKTDFLATRVTFRMDLSKLETLEEQGYNVKVYGVVKKGDVTKEVQVYGAGKTGVYNKRGEFSIVVKNASSYNEEFEYSAKLVITDQYGTAEAITVSKDMSSNKNLAVSMYEVAKHYSKKSYKDDRDTMYDEIVAAAENAQ